MNGLSNFINIDRDELKILHEHDFICLQETWIVSDKINLFSFVNEYGSFHISAVKNDNSRGRPSGGIAVLHKKDKFRIFEKIVILYVLYLRKLNQKNCLPL